jgi:hypothetical protein
MRDLLNILSVFEEKGPDVRELEAFKSAIASKIKVLPADDATAKTLKEIEELLQHVNAGGRMGMIKGQLHAINDPAVMAAQKRLAQYLASMEVSPEDRAELFSLWKADKLVNIDKLLAKKQCTFNDVFNKYGQNAAVTELIDDVMQTADLGQGKGEFGLNVLSKSVAKPGGLGDFTDHIENAEDSEEEQKGKGDLIIKSRGKWRKVECKTTHGGAARFSDQEVRPAEGYEKAANDLNRFVEQFKGTSMYNTVLPKGMAKGYGLNLRSAIALYDPWMKQGEYGPQYLKLVENVITLIFGGADADKQRIKAIMNAFKAGNAGETIQQYAQASFAYYMSKKDDEGVLAININEKTFMFYSTAEDLTKEKLRFNADTVYLTAKDVARGAYPQMSIQQTTFGANAAAAAEKQAQKDAIKTARDNPVTPPEMAQPAPTKKPEQKELEDKVFAYVTNAANAKGIFDQNFIGELALQTLNLLQAQAPQDAVKKTINTQITQFKQRQAQQAPAQQQQQPVQPTVESIRFGRQRRA